MPNYLSPGVYVEEVDGGARPIEGVGTAVAAFIGSAPKGPVNQPVLVTNWSQYTQIFGEFMEGSYLDDAVYGYFLNGGGAAYIVRVGGDGAAKKAAGALPAPKDAEKDPKVGPLEIEAVAGGADGNDISVEVADPTDKDEKGENFKLVVKVGGKVEEEYDNLNADTAVRTVNAKSKLIKLASPTGAKAIAPTKGAVKLAGGGVSEPARLAPDDYIGSSADRTGFGGLEAVDEITMLACPDLMAAYQTGLIDLEGVQAVQLAMIAHCEAMGDRLAILDPPPGLNAQQIKEWRVDKAGYDSKYAVLYWPWVKVFDPASGENIFVPPSGHMAGIWGRNDDTRGVHKAPANEVVRGAIDLELRITKTEHDLLNPEGINVIRAFPGRGIRVWGARTLSSDPAWRYVNVRRLFNYLEESILGGTQWTVFEPNDHSLWAKIRRAISAFLVMEWRKGALFGLTPGEAFYVKCDGENNTAESIDSGMVICEVGVAPVKPAEFVVFKLSQFSGGASSVEE